MIPFSYNLRNLAVRRATTAASALGIALVVFVFSSVAMLAKGIERTVGVAGRPDVAVVLSRGSRAELESTLEEETAKLVLAKPGIAQGQDGELLVAKEMSIVLTMDKLGTSGVSNVTVRGIPAQALVQKFRPEVKLAAGRWAEAPDEVVVGKAIRGRFKGLELGSEVELRKNRSFKVVGVFEAGGSVFDSEVWADFETVRTIFGRTGLASALRVRLTTPDAFEGFKASIETDRAIPYKVVRETKYYQDQSDGLADFLTGMGYTIAVLFAIGAMIGAMITMHSSVANRQREIGTLRALGFSRGQILISFLIESTLLALAGGIVGALTSLLMGWVRFSMMNFATWSEIVLTFEPTPLIVLGALMFGSGIGLLGGFLPALRAAGTSPARAMRA